MKLATQISLGFFIVILIDLFDSYVNYSLTRKVNTNTDFLTNSEAIIRNSSNLDKSIIEMQSAFRGFLLTDDESFLAKYHDGLKLIPELSRQESRLINPSSPQHAKLDSIMLLHRQWLDRANVLIAAKRRAISNAAYTGQYNRLFEYQYKAYVGKNYNEKITQIFASFDRYEYFVREERRKALALSIRNTEKFSILFSTLTILVGICGAIYLVRKISKRIDSMVTLAENISKGNFSTLDDDKKDELSSLSTSLNAMSGTLSRNIHELEKKNVDLNQFAYVVSHDLKAPVRGIYNVIQWIEEDLDQEISPKMRKYLDIIPERIRRMENLIDGLLEFARLSREKPLKENVDVAVLVRELAEEIVPAEFQFSVSGLPELNTEKLLLTQIFSNLISNSVKYTVSKNGKIEVLCKEQKYFYEFTVRDNGVGIEQQYHEKIFEIFQTLREKHDKESTGIGLAIVKKIIEDKHCSISVNSSLGNGASFIFTWPKN